ncbi:putative acetyltransferase [Streptomyces ambofaciens ATCC 23877]|uniref:Putative acetyltransferase n=1 Tax=Streptomyces ambofaciens (strain ATCC 23877 / 3486 / DSM 40053 / JCM 4204 / NBRC 12836 / NRRL B-2516) TaxID=278992 RepID=A0ACG8_STRA7|nr:GNAT family N-acetyltransferase [Streptomyces ambofaciens]AKZ60174.1 putative acetyltransferase [Streptomyces ambofaciens ATCC 23877]CAJ88172.1 putative acetyltransferase [Streptomyces ambofaciens ATCC 23877]
MLPEAWHLTQDVDDFLARAGDFLRSRPALHNTVLTDIEKLRTHAAAGRGGEAAVLGRLESAGAVRAVFYRTPRGRLGLTALSAERADALAVHLAGLGHRPSTVIADHDTATAFAESWRRCTGAATALFWRTHLYRLGTLTPPQPPPQGRGRVTGEADREQVVSWCREFCVDVAEQSSIDLIDAGAWGDSRFGDRHFTFWETADGTPVSMAAATSLVGGMIRVDPVYTPAPVRGRGYAGAVTVEVSRAALAAGATDVVLYTDPGNPTSNALYQRIGYVRVADFAGYEFSSGTSRSG